MDTTKTFEGGSVETKNQTKALVTIPEDKDWQDLGNCLGVDPDLFFPERGASVKEAKEVCRGCLVSEVCLEYALVNGEKFGIWGGMSERERRRLRRARGLTRSTGRTAVNSETVN